MAILKIRKPDGSVQEVQTLVGPKGDTGATGPQGPAGSDASVTSQNIATALGFTPANASTVSQQSAEIAELQTGKQDTLTAGDNITIVDNVISASGGGSGGTAKKFELIETITFAEDATEFTRNAEPNGSAYKFKRMKFVYETKTTAPGSADHGWMNINNGVYFMNFGNCVNGVNSVIIARFGEDEYGDVHTSVVSCGAGSTSYSDPTQYANYRHMGKLEMVTGNFICNSVRWYNAHFKAGQTVKIYGVRA